MTVVGTNWVDVWLNQHNEKGLDHEKAYTFSALSPDADAMDLMSQRRVVMAIPLSIDGANTRVANYGSMLLLYLNPHPRPSFMFHPDASVGPLAESIQERFGFSLASATDLASCILQTIPKQGREG